MNFQYIRIIITLLAFTTMVSCRVKDDLENLTLDNWKPEIALLLINTDFTAADVILKFDSNHYIEADSDDVLHLVYSGTVFSVQGSDLIDLPDFVWNFSGNSDIYTLPMPGGEKLYNLQMKSGILHARAKSTATEDVEIMLEIPSIRQNGLILRDTFLMDFTGATPVYVTHQHDMRNSRWDFTQGGTGWNEIVIQASARSVATGQPVPVEEIQFSFSGLDFSNFSGNVGLKPVTVNDDRIRIEIFENWKSGSVSISDPKIRLAFVNSFGIPLTVYLTNFSGQNEGNILQMSGSVFNGGIHIDFPDTNSTVGWDSTGLIINSENSNIRNILSISPTSIHYGFSILANADSTIFNFFSDTSKLKINLSLDIPFKGKLDNLVLRDTIAIYTSDLTMIERTELKLIIENSFPVNAGIQLYMTDKNYLVMDSLMPGKGEIIYAPEVTRSGYSIGSRAQTTSINLTEAKMETLLKSEFFILESHLLSPLQGKKLIRLQSGNKIKVKLAAKTVIKPVQ